MPKPEIALCMDSGAFSAFTQGNPVNLEEYTEFLLKNPEHIAHAVALDSINPNDPETAASTGWDNLLYMRDKGIEAIPVYHARESIKWFDKMLDTTDYIGISGTSLVSPTEHLAFYDLAWNYATDSEGYPIAKFHAFGDLAPYSMLTYPWYSADASTWMIMGGRAGSVKLGGKSYRLRSKTVCDGNYISADAVGPEKESWERECRYLGLDPDRVMKVTTNGSQMAMIRSYLVASDIIKLQQRSEDCKQFRKPKTLINSKKKETGGFTREGPVRIFFVISPSAFQFNFPVILALGIKDILVSYYYVVREKKKFWEEKLVPFLYDPEGFCKTDPKTKIFYDKLNECLLKEPVGV